MSSLWASGLLSQKLSKELSVRTVSALSQTCEGFTLFLRQSGCKEPCLLPMPGWGRLLGSLAVLQPLEDNCFPYKPSLVMLDLRTIHWPSPPVSGGICGWVGSESVEIHITACKVTAPCGGAGPGTWVPAAWGRVWAPPPLAGWLTWPLFLNILTCGDSNKPPSRGYSI